MCGRNAVVSGTRNRSSTVEPPGSAADAVEPVDPALIHSSGDPNCSISSFDAHRIDTVKVELIVTLHRQRATTLDAGDDRWLHTRTTRTGAMSPWVCAAWTEKPATRQLNCWLDRYLSENGLLARYQARAQSMLQAAGGPYETPKIAEILRANADAQFAGAIRFDTERSPSDALQGREQGPSVGGSARDREFSVRGHEAPSLRAGARRSGSQERLRNA